MALEIQLGDIAIDVVLKDIKNVHLSVYPPHGRVRIAAPLRTSLDILRIFAITRLDWIKRQQAELQAQERETPREYLERESHYVWGKRCLLAVWEFEGPPFIELAHDRLLLRERPGTSEEKRQRLVEEWYREQMKAAIPPLLERWEPRIGVSTRRFFVQRMKTRWGSCNTTACTIRLNSELAKKPPECLEYILVHELIHLLEPTHNARFIGLMDRFMPSWQLRRQALNRLPVREESWRY